MDEEAVNVIHNEYIEATLQLERIDQNIRKIEERNRVKHLELMIESLSEAAYRTLREKEADPR